MIFKEQLLVFQKGVYYAGVILHKLPLKIKCLSTNSKQLRAALKEFLLTHVFYSADEFILVRND
jgi:hypothetical protein